MVAALITIELCMHRIHMHSKNNHRARPVPKMQVQKVLANLSLGSLSFVPDWPDFNTSSPFDVSSQQQGEDIYVQIKTHIKHYMNKEITYQNFIFNPRHILEYLFSFSCYFWLVFTIWKVQTNNSNENAKNVTHVHKYSLAPKKLKIAHTYCSNSLTNTLLCVPHFKIYIFHFGIQSVRV